MLNDSEIRYIFQHNDFIFTRDRLSVKQTVNMFSYFVTAEYIYFFKEILFPFVVEGVNTTKDNLYFIIRKEYKSKIAFE